MMQNWKIRSRSNVCDETEVAFQDGDVVFTAVYEEKEGISRRDFSAAAWAEGIPGPTPFSSWKSIYRAELEPESESGGIRADLDQSVAADLLVQLLEQVDDPSLNQIRYLLVVMLERKRGVKLVGERNDEGETLLIYEFPKSGEVFAILDPQIRLEEIETVQNEVIAMLDQMNREV